MTSYTTIICVLVLVFALMAFGIYMTGARTRYNVFTKELRRTGAYDQWAEKYKVLLVLEKVSIVAVLLGFPAFLITGMMNYLDISQVLFAGFLIFLVTGVVASFLLVRTVPRDWRK